MTTPAVAPSGVNITLSQSIRLGCFNDNIHRVLDGPVALSQVGNQPTTCETWCKNQGYHLFGLEVGNECRCGNSIKNGLGIVTQYTSTGSCKQQCPGGTGTCGGNWAMDIWGKCACGFLVLISDI
jgi:hypothetical protein